MSKKTKQLINTSRMCSQAKKGLGRFFSNNAFVLLAFILPFLIMLINFAVKKFAPFGDLQILVIDLWHQYYPFLVDFQDKIIDGQSMLHSWTNGMGGNYLALISYYVASPINFLTAFVPSSFLVEFLMLSVCVEIGCASGFMAIFLKKTFHKNGLPLVFFSMGYGCCAFFMGYYWNVIWLNTVAMLPLMALGMVYLWREGKFCLYTIALALSIIANYYVGFFICIFTLLCFIGYSIMYWNGWRDFVARLLRTGLFTAIALMITAFLSLPAYNGLNLTYSTNNHFPDYWNVYYHWSEVMSQTLDFIPPSTKENLPNIACGMAALFFGIIFLTTRKISWRAKAFSVSMLAFLVVSFNVNMLDYIWHGFHATNMIPHRFAFLFSFVLLVMAYRAYTLIEKAKIWNILLGFFGASLLIVVSSLFQAGTPLWGSFLLICILTVVTGLYIFKIYPKVVLDLLIFLLVSAEMFITAGLGIKAVGSTSTSTYPEGKEVTADLIRAMNNMETNTTDMWRAEMTKTQTLNDASLNGYRGISQFSSMSNVSVTKFLEEFGCQGWQSGNRYTYRESSPITNLFLNLKYLISRDGIYSATEYVSPVYQNGSEVLLKNNYYLPMGFVTDKGLLNYTLEDRDPDDFSNLNTFDKQNEFFAKATGVTEDVYKIIEPMETVASYAGANPVTINKLFPDSDHGYDFNINTTGATELKTIEFNYEINEAGNYFVYPLYYSGGLDTKAVNIKRDGISVKNDGDIGRPYIINAGRYESGQKLTVSLENIPINIATNFICYVAKLNDDVFKTGYEKLAANSMTATKVTDTAIEGTIDCNRDGLFYTSVVYEDGWTVKVDGEKVETKKVGGAMLAFDITAGTHTVEMSYIPSGFIVGTVASILGIFMLIAAAFLYRTHLSKTFLFKYKTHPDANPDRFDDELEDENTIVLPEATAENNKEKELSLTAKILLSIVLLPFYFAVWFAGLIKKIKILTQENTSYTTDIVLSLIVPFYFVYVVYKYSIKKKQLAKTEDLKVTSAFNHMALELGASCGILVSVLTVAINLIDNLDQYLSELKTRESILSSGGTPPEPTVTLLPTGISLSICIFCLGLGIILRIVNLYIFDNDISRIIKKKKKKFKAY
ncbi:MAG: YfhO family protein [Oscillospiraceae bacterium]|nr:YfhO family protein [Oscillospiraceae bacterium]